MSLSIDEAGAVLELRRYTLHPGRREALIALFEREFVHTQQACGIRLPGQFRDLDRPDQFVWLRGFEDLADRPRALGDFYGGPAWRAFRDEANATMLDSDDVLLLRPLPGPTGGRAAPAGPQGLIVAGVCALATPDDPALLAAFEAKVLPLLADQGASLLGRWLGDPARLPNNFPRLPVRADGPVFVWLSQHPAGLQDEARLRAALAGARSLLLSRLRPTAGSALQL